MKKIELTQGRFAIVDDEDFDYINQWSWFARKDGSTWYAVRSPKRQAGKSRKQISMHRVIMNTPNCLETDHIDGNGLNNQKSNLRNCTHSQNIMNEKKRKSCSSIYKGVSRLGKKWVSQISNNGNKIYIGVFETEKEAALAYDKTALKLFGEFAKTNIPLEIDSWEH